MNAPPTEEIQLKHFGDPCIHCGIAHDEVPVGPCQGDPEKAVPIAYRSLGVRHDNVEHFLIRMSTNVLVDRWEHIEMQLPYTYLKDVRYDETLRRNAT